MKKRFFPGPIDQTPAEFNQPVFITGVPRSGSSWVGKTLGSCAKVRYVYEPFNLDWMPILRGSVSHFKYLNTMSKAPRVLQRVADEAFSGLQGRDQLLRSIYRGYWRAATRPADKVVVKDPTAPLMAAWITKRFNAKVLIVMRHPCGFTSSLDRLNWQVDIDYLLRQKTLMRNHLGPYEDVLRNSRKDEWCSRGAFWAAIHRVLSEQASSKKGWYFCRYEDLCTDPLGQFSRLARKLDLPSIKVEVTEKRLSNLMTDADQGSTWRNSSAMPGVWRQRMTQNQIDSVMEVVRKFELEFYSD